MLDINEGQLISLRLALKSNYLDVTNLLEAQNDLGEVIDAPLLSRHVAPLVVRGYWTANDVEVTEVDAGTDVIANVILTTYDSMKASGTVTLEVWKDILWGNTKFKSVTESLNLEAGDYKQVQLQFTAETTRNSYFKGYYLKVYFTGLGISNNLDEPRNRIENVLVTWRDSGEGSMQTRLNVNGGSIIIRLGSPANILVTAPNGLRIGYDSNANNTVNEIAGALYSGSETDSQIISIPNPILGNCMHACILLTFLALEQETIL